MVPSTMETSSRNDALRILTWNIGHGGGSRIPAICRHIEETCPDILGLTEFRTRNEPALRTYLDRLGYPFVVTSEPPGMQNGLLVASRYAFGAAAEQYPGDTDRERWLALHFPDFDLDILVLHIPSGTDNKFEAGYSISGVKRKKLFWENVITYAAGHKDRKAIMMGDFNTGFRIDAEGTMFQLSRYMAELIDTGFIDTWRRLHRDIRDYTWYSKRKDKETGVSGDFNGFRLDYIFISPALEHATTDVVICHEPRCAGVSDHASLVASIDLRAAARQEVVSYDDMSRSKVTTPAVVSTPNQDTNDLAAGIDGSAGRPMRVQAVDAGRHGVRFDLMPGELADMACGVNGQSLVQDFRPTYVTAKWSSGVLVEVRIWGPRVLKDGSLGARELDHVWKAIAASGGVDCSELPYPIASRLRSYLTE